MDTRFSEASPTWQTIKKHLKEKREVLVQELIERESPQVRAQILAIDDILRLPETFNPIE